MADFRHDTASRRIRRGAALTALICAFASCATQRPPDGGPVDTIPPTVVRTQPATGTTHFTGSSARFEFSEYVDRTSFQQALHISPYSPVPPVLSWSGRTVTVQFPSPLQPERTYVLTVGTGLKDQHNGNPMASTYTLAFSTGDTLDAGTFSGHVYDAKPSGVSIFAYRIDGTRADTLDPRKLRPDYLVQAGGDGTFVFNNVAAGPYRCFAVRDKQSNALYDPESDEIGVAQADLRVPGTDSVSHPLQFRLVMEDTTAPFVQSVEAAGIRTVLVKFGESVRAPAPEDYVITDSATGARHAVASISPLRGSKNGVTLVVDPPMGTGRMLLRIDTLLDLAGNRSSIATPFDGSAVADTGRPAVASSFPSRNDAVHPDSAFEIVFTRPLLRTPDIALRDSAGADIRAAVSRPATNAVRITHPALAELRPFRMCIDMRTVRDSLTDRAAGDSSVCIPFRTTARLLPGSISGAVTGADPDGAAIVVRCARADKTRAMMRTTVKADGTYVIPDVPEGLYTMDAFIDSDGTGTWNAGRPYPYRPSARFAIGRDTIRVRARWETANVRITFK